MTTIHTIDVLVWIGLVAFFGVLVWGLIWSHWAVRRYPEKYLRKTGTPGHGQNVHGGYESNPVINSPTYSNVPGNIHHR